MIIFEQIFIHSVFKCYSVDLWAWSFMKDPESNQFDLSIVPLVSIYKEWNYRSSPICLYTLGRSVINPSYLYTLGLSVIQLVALVYIDEGWDISSVGIVHIEPFDDMSHSPSILTRVDHLSYTLNSFDDMSHSLVNMYKTRPFVIRFKLIWWHVSYSCQYVQD